MAEYVHIIRFPDGDVAFHNGAFVPSIGDRFTRGDTAWVVVRVAVEEGGLGITVKPEGAARTTPGPSLGGSRTEE